MDIIKKALLSRWSVIIEIALILISVVISYIVPQRFTSTERETELWLHSNPLWKPFFAYLGLDHVFTTPWFAMLLILFCISLIFSMIEQIRYCTRLTFGPSTTHYDGGISAALSAEVIQSIIKDRGYIKIFNDSNFIRFVKYPWGYWGNVLLHLGIIVIIVASLILLVTEKSGLLHLLEGEIFRPGDKWVMQEQGLLAERLQIRDAIRLDKVITEFWETDDFRDLSTIITFIDRNNHETRYHLGVNRAATHRGLRIYQGRRVGHGFYVELTGPGGEKYYKIIQLEYPKRRDRASYGNFMIKDIPYTLKTKYFADADRESMTGKNPLLVMRLVRPERAIKKIYQDNDSKRLTMDLTEKDTVIGEVSLKYGESGKLGPYTAKFVHFEPWSSIVIVESHGMYGIFAGFIIIILGVSLTYFTPPREISVERFENNYVIFFKSHRFEKLYESEFKDIETEIRKADKQRNML